MCGGGELIKCIKTQGGNGAFFRAGCMSSLLLSFREDVN